MLTLLLAVTAWAEVNPTALPEVSTDGNIVLYTIKNTRSGKYATFNGESSQMSQQTTVSLNSLFYFTASAAATAEGFTPVMIHNAATNSMLADWASWTEAGKAWYLSVDCRGGVPAGLHITNNANYNGWNSWNDANSSSITYYAANDAGSVFVIEKADLATVIADAKAAAKAKIENYAQLTNVFPAAGEYTAQVDAIETASLETFAAIDAVVTSYINTASNKYLTINTPGRANNGYMQMTASKVVGTATAAAPANIWQFVANNASLNIYNPYTGLYMCATAGNSAVVAVTDNQANAGAYTFTINEEAANADAKVKIGVNGANVHMDGSFNLVRWDNGGASEWTVTVIEDFSSIIDAYKTASIASMDEWKSLSVVFNASLITAAEETINAINTNSYATFAAIDAEIKKVTDAVAAKMFTFQTLATDNHRNGVWVSANPSTGKAIGLHGEHNYNSIWSLRHAGGTSFYMFNELNEVYMGAPSANCPLTETPSVAYTFEIIDAASGVVEMKCNGETMHASNHDDDKLLNWDGDENASRWYIRTIDIAADIQAILDGLTEADYADVPALGQYPTAAYNALVEARTNAKTVEEVEHAIAAFNKAKNVPVYFITSAWENSYAAGKAIMYNGSAWRFETANKYNRQMWMTIPAHKAEAAPIVDTFDSENGTFYAICDYLTGNVMRGYEVQIVKIAGWDGAYNLQYSANDAQHAQNGGALVRWLPATADDYQASAWSIEFIGNSYDLDKLTDEHIAALSALQTTYNNKANFANAEIGEALGQYSEGNIEAIVAAEAAAKAIVNASVAVQATMSVQDINAAATSLNESVATLKINLPEAGCYYRIQGACAAAAGYENYYITGHTNEDGGRIALTKDADASTIYYFDGTNLIAYESGLVIGLNNAHWTFASIDDNSNPASTIVFAQSPRTAGTYTVKSADRYFHYYYYSANNTVQVNRCQNDDCKEHDWYLEQVTELPVSITAAQYATFYAPVAVEVAEGVTAHTVTVDGEWAVLSEESLKVIPANTGVVLVGAENSYSFAITTADAFEGENCMAGTIAKSLVAKENAECYVLANGENGVGLYSAAKGEDATVFYNAGHKAYLAVEGAAGVQSYSFRFGGATTAIENVVVENASNVIFDLTGRKIEAIAAPGIYVVNGKKVLVK